MSRSEIWYEEKHEDYYGMRFRVKKTLFSGTSEFQHVEVIETVGHGKMLTNDGLVMVTERDEFVYHEMVAHVPLFVHPGAANVLVIGGGDGGTVREVLKHPEVEKCTLVEIDKMVVDACVEHIPLTSSALSDSRVEVVIDDGVKFVNQSKPNQYDLIIVDSTDPIGPAAPLFGSDFYTDVNRVLNETGIVVSQGESPFYLAETQLSMVKVLSPIFKNTFIYNFSNLTYPGGLWSFTFAAKSEVNPISDFKQEQYHNLKLDLDYYNSSIHKSCFSLPGFQRKNLGEFLTPLG